MYKEMMAFFNAEYTYLKNTNHTLNKFSYMG